MGSKGFVKCAVASTRMKVANPEYNSKMMIEAIGEACEKHVKILVFPELCITGYTCGDLFHQDRLLAASNGALKRVAESTRGSDVLVFIGAPLQFESGLYNCAVAVQDGEILGAVPKVYIPNYREFYEKRWFSSGRGIVKKSRKINILGREYPFGELIFESPNMGYKVGVEICEDLWAPIPKSSYSALKGANIIVNPSASNDVASKFEYRKSLIEQQSGRTQCIYLYSSSGVHESTTDVVFGGDCIICENGTVLKRSEKFKREGFVITADVDVQRVEYERRINKTFSDNAEFSDGGIDFVSIMLKPQEYDPDVEDLEREVSKTPFIPCACESSGERFEDIFNIQVAGLAKRIETIGLKHSVIGISGGLDSTLALLVTVQTYKLLGKPVEDIIGITMPGFGTTGQTYQNSIELMKKMGVTSLEIDIKPACNQHFSDIGHCGKVHDITYENVQARERTQILMDIANKYSGIVIGTGDLSEIALGWSTYNGDHMSMYAVNCGVPKTLVAVLVEWFAKYMADDEAANILKDVVATPISPELTPPDESGEMAQKTEDILGPYIMHDFFLYYTIRQGTSPEKLLFIAKKAFGKEYSEEKIKEHLSTFYRRFFTQQFKRSCIPDGPKVGTVSLSPRGDWRMPSDADFGAWRTL